MNNKVSCSLLDKKNCQFRANWNSNWNYRVCNQTCNVALALVFIPHSQSFILYFLPFRLLILLAKKIILFFNSQEMAQSFFHFFFHFEFQINYLSSSKTFQATRSSSRVSQLFLPFSFCRYAEDILIIFKVPVAPRLYPGHST